MFRFRVLLLVGPLLSAGCLYSTKERTEQAVSGLTAQPFDLQPSSTPAASPPPSESAGEKKPAFLPVVSTDVQTTALLQPAPALPPAVKDLKDRIQIPEAIPGAETPKIAAWPTDEAGKLQAIRALYPPLPALPVAPTPLPGPNGQPYTLAALHQIAAANSPALIDAASDVQAAWGNLIQARAYPNPTMGLEVDPSNDGSAAGVWGLFIDQPIKTFGKLRLAAAAAQKDLDNAELALKRARSDLATQVRNAYFAVLVAKESVRVNKALAEFTDEVYRFQEVLLERSGTAGNYEPAALRGQAYTARLAYKQAIQSYVTAWQQLVTAIGLRRMPLTEVAGRVDAFIPYYDYDAVLAHVLAEHTDVRTARNAIDKARYNLKLAQVTPWPDVDVRVAILKEFALPPEKYVHTVQVGMPIPIWDQNKGNIIAAEAAQVRAAEEPHRVELNLTNTLELAYQNYKSNLDGLEYYRKYILPDQIRTYRGVFIRRNVDLGVTFGDLVSAQQTLATSVGQYLTTLGLVWTYVVSVADLLQTDDLFQMAQPLEVPPLHDLDVLPSLPCCHPAACRPAGEVAPHAAAAPSPVEQPRKVMPPAAPVSKPPTVAAPAPPRQLPPVLPPVEPALAPPSLLLEPPPTIGKSAERQPLP
jgi:cobalt-zinc-cadmium efflux system outer membrane protein